MAKMILKRGFLQVLLAALLLAAQHGALTHQMRHLQGNAPVQSQQDTGGKQTSQTGLCDFHVAFVQVLGALSSVAPPLQIAVNAVERSSNHFPPAYPANLVIPASRGPPVLL
jgi:hypothetical protein